MYKAFYLAAFVMTVFCLALPVRAQQSATANLSGRVTDPAGAVIVGAQVVIEQSATGFRREITTNSEGLYVCASLPAGETAENLVLLHPECHRKAHSLKLEVMKPRPERGV
jgi:hypothetical protein